MGASSRRSLAITTSSISGDLAADQHTIYFTNSVTPELETAAAESDFPARSANKRIRRFDLNTGEYQSDFPAPAELHQASGLRVLPGGGVIVADMTRTIRHYGSTGNLVRTYVAPLADPSKPTDEDEGYFAVNLDPDGTSFWTANYYTGIVARFDIASGRLLTQSQARQEINQFTALAVYDEPTAATHDEVKFVYHAHAPATRRTTPSSI
jgi:hypothetical protein